MLQFEYIKLLWLLLLLPILVIVFFYALYKKKQVAKQLGDENLINQLTKNYSAKAFKISHC
jgi:competence protein ComGC